MIWSTDPCY